mmetsp:Transcript_60979/g.180504  ORF Transcript_60979/g.180504 Transcript_60979/m.180504 type:complete len:187 (+) Transcript_60979:1142-1702(+)
MDGRWSGKLRIEYVHVKNHKLSNSCALFTCNIATFLEFSFFPSPQAQYMWCILHIALARPSCRDNGIVLMIDKRYLATAAKDYNFAGRRLMVKLTTRCLPLRVCAIHIFFAPSSWWQRYMIPVFSMVGVFGKKRTVVHIETSEENRRVLKEQFGIGPNLVLKDLGGNVDTDWWKGWIRERREEECS